MSGWKTLLLVEDDEPTREAMAQLMREQGYLVQWAADGHEALDSLRSKPLPDCILLNLAMPRLDGRLFLVRQRQHSRWSAIPVVIVSGDPRVAEAAAFLDVADYLKKPIDPDELLAAVRRNC